jgi:putative oxidoreductase
MRIAMLVVRTLLGLVFFVFGLNGFLHFISNQPMPGNAAAFIGALASTGYMIPLIFTAQVVGGAMLLLGMAVPFALALLAPVIVNIFFFHLFLAPGGLVIAIVVCAIELFLAWYHWDAFAPLFGGRSNP